MRKDIGPSIHVYIDRLILDGLPVDQIQAPHLQAAVEVELRQLLLQNDLSADLQAGGGVPSVRADTIQLTASRNPSSMGTQIAQSIYSGIGNK